ncbi:hypothetical protein [Streptomyces alboflavus]|uniref:hypothetical protein n=1 Tax=Streptomyces alboflavus TaxID=67267 RepID=UPI001F3E787B|nr:hypothetical protein [Streptomyces alboflavus]
MSDMDRAMNKGVKGAEGTDIEGTDAEGTDAEGAARTVNAAKGDGAVGADKVTVGAPAAPADKPLGVLAAAIAAAPPPWWHWRSLRRLTRGHRRRAVAAAVAGALLGGTLVAWQVEAGPFEREQACWGALDEDDVADLFHGKRDIEYSQMDIGYDRIASDGPSGRCELRSPRGHRVRAQLHRLDTRFGGDRDVWADEYLSARMTPLGGGLLGMVSDTRAWLAVPEGCVGRTPTGTARSSSTWRRAGRRTATPSTPTNAPGSPAPSSSSSTTTWPTRAATATSPTPPTASPPPRGSSTRSRRRSAASRGSGCPARARAAATSAPW